MSAFKRAFALPKEEIEKLTPPGTTVLIHREDQNREGGGHIVLVPDPSDDPADPLNWKWWSKVGLLICASFYAFVGNFTSASIASAFPLLATPAVFNPPVPMKRLSYLVAVNVLLLGAANLWNVPLANTFGRRPVVLFSLLLLTLSSMWAGLATSFGSLLAARAFMGVGASVSETLSPAAIGEVFFVHQRGRAMAVYTMSIALGPFLGGLSGSYIAFRYGISWLHWANVILSAICLALCFFLLPETLYVRKQRLSTVRTGDEREKSDARFEKTIEESISPPSYKTFTFAQSLKVGRYEGGLLSKLGGPWLSLRLPGVWLVMFWYAGLVGGIVTVTTISPQVMASPPYLWHDHIGLANVGGIVGTFVGAAYTYFVADRVLTGQVKHEAHGFAESESRLKTTLPGLFVATTGLWVFGFCADHPGGAKWVGMQFGLGMLAFGLIQTPSVGFNYASTLLNLIIDSYGKAASDCFVAVVGMRAIIAFSWTFFIGEWVAKAGTSVPFGVFGGLMGIFSLLVFVILIWGKRFRVATAQWVQ
ncbi:MFS general substrate transporter [Eremomyces bilateralis CBS 781.70]|uniref:MFS general substrate transporter n=1 Tax=Eremomyces bilateralis CBS 781.70 TaxID=1392243 RepID=A0A6G1GED4_9PEZI|nr:MFS general substrate transporter [Eremomyces bilateralis CBS 781.70]KAF1816418.1 MFS general substrate transporter [Eremomyces bilateralis CBS 781.70]